MQQPRKRSLYQIEEEGALTILRSFEIASHIKKILFFYFSFLNSEKCRVIVKSVRYGLQYHQRVLLKEFAQVKKYNQDGVLKMNVNRSLKVSSPAPFTLIELMAKKSHLCCDRAYSKEEVFSPARGQVKLYSFTLIELLVSATC